MDGAAVESAEAKASLSQHDEGRPGDVVVLDDRNDPQGRNVMMTSTAAPSPEPSVDPSADCVSPIEEADGRDGTFDAASPAPAPDAGVNNGRDDATRIRRTVSDGDDPPVPPSHESEAVIDGEGEDGVAQLVTDVQFTTTTTSEEVDSAAAAWLLSEATKADGDDGDVDVKVPEPAQLGSPDRSPTSDVRGKTKEEETPPAADDSADLRPPDDDSEGPVDLDSAAAVSDKEEEVVAAEESAESLHDKSDLVKADLVEEGPSVDVGVMVDAVASSEIGTPVVENENESLPSSELREKEAEGLAAGDEVNAAEGTSVPAATEAVTETASVDVSADFLGDGGQDNATAGDSDLAPLDKVESGTALDDSAAVDGALSSPPEDTTLVAPTGIVAPVAEAAGDSDPSPLDDIESGPCLDESDVNVKLRSPPEDSEIVESNDDVTPIGGAAGDSDPSPSDAVEPGPSLDDDAAVDATMSSPQEVSAVVESSTNFVPSVRDAAGDSDPSPLDAGASGTSAAMVALSSPPTESATVDSSTSFAPIDAEPLAAAVDALDNESDEGGAEGTNEPDAARSFIVADGEDLDVVLPATPAPSPPGIDEVPVSDEIVETIDGPDVNNLNAPPEDAALVVVAGMPGSGGNGTLPIDEKATRKRPWDEGEAPPAASGSGGTGSLTSAVAGTEASNPESPPETFKSKKSKKEKKQKKEKKRKKEKKKKKDKKKKSKGSSVSSSEYDDTSCYDSTSCDDSEAQDSDAPLIPREVQSSTIQGSGVLLPPPTFDDSAEFDDLHDDRLLDAVPTPHSPELIAAPHSEMDSQKEGVANETPDGADSQLGMCSTGNSDDAPDEAAPVSTTSNEASTAILGNVDDAGSPPLEDSAVKTEEEAESLMTASAQVPVPVEVDSIQVDAPDEIVSLGREVPVIGAAADVSSNGNDRERNEKSADDLALESLESDVPSLTNIDTAQERTVEPAGELFGDTKVLEAENNSAEVILSDDATTSEPDCERSKAAELSTVNQLDHESDTAIIVEVTDEKGGDDDSKSRNVVQSLLENVDAESSTVHAPFPSAESEAALDGESKAEIDQSRAIQNDAETQSAEGLAAGVESAELTSAPAEQVDSTSEGAESRMPDNVDNHVVTAGATEPVAETDREMSKVVDPLALDPLDPDSNAADALAVDVVEVAHPGYEITEVVELSNLNELDSGIDTAHTLVSNVETAASRNDESSPVAEESVLDQLDDAAGALESNIVIAAKPDAERSQLVEQLRLDQLDCKMNAVEAIGAHVGTTVEPDGESSQLVEHASLDQLDSKINDLGAPLSIVEAAAGTDGESRKPDEVYQPDAESMIAEALLSHADRAVVPFPSEALGDTADVTEEKELFIAKATQLDAVTDPASVEEVELTESPQHTKLQEGDLEATHLMDHDRERLETKAQPRAVDDAPDKPTMLVLVSNHALKREVVANQQMAFTVLSARKIPYETLDGSIIENQQRRNELFELSGLRGQYPQFFKLSQSEAEDSGATFYGDWDQFQWANECGTLVQDFARAGEDEPLIAGSDGGGPPPINKPESDAENSAEAADNFVPNSVDSTVEAKDASQIGGEVELSKEAATTDRCADTPTDPLPLVNAAVAPAVFVDSMNQEINEEEPVRAGRRSPIPPKKAVQVPAAFLGPVATQSTKYEPKTLRSTSPIPPKRAVVVPAAFACLADQRSADEGSRLVANPSPKLTKKAVVVPVAFGGQNDVDAFERTDERPRRSGRSSPIPPKKAVVVPAAFGGKKVQESESEKETPEPSQRSPLPSKQAVVVPAAFAGSEPKEATSVEDPERLVRSPTLSYNKALVVPAAFTNAGKQTSTARASPIPLRKSAAVLVSGSGSSRSQPESGDVSKPTPTSGSRKVVVPGAFVGVESRKPDNTPSSSPLSEKHSGLSLPLVGKLKQPGTESAASPTQVRRTLIFPDDGNLEYGVVESRSEPTSATQPSRKKLAIPGAFSSPDSKPQTSSISPIKEIGSVKKQSKLPIPSAFSTSMDLDQSGAPTPNPDLKFDSSSHRGSAHIRTDTKTKLSIPAAFGGGTKPSDFAVQNGEEFAMKSSSDHIASSFSSPSKKLAIPAAFGSSPASRSAQSMLSQSMHTTPTKKFPVPAVSAVRGSPATSSTSDGGDERRTHREVATNSVPAPPTQTNKKKLQIPAAFGHQQSSSNPVPPVGATPPKVRLFGTAERDGDTPSLGSIGDVAAVQSTSPPKDWVAAAEPSPFRRKLAIPGAFGKTSSHSLSSSSHHSPAKPLRPSSASGLSSSSHHRASTIPPQPTKTPPSPGPSITSGAASKIGSPRSSISSTASKYVTVGDTVMTRAAAAAFAAHEDSLMMADDNDDTGDIPMRRRSQPGRRPSITSASSSSPTPAAPKRKVAIPAAFLGGGSSQP